MPPRALIDTGAIVALLDASDSWHQAISAAIAHVPLPFATTAAVLTEVMHFYGDRPDRLARAWRLIRSPAVVVLPIDGSDLPDLERLMKRYADIPMDFADASLVRLAEREGLSTILTVDRDFEIYRIGGRRRFRCLPAD